jgi:PAS domain S-box-containing protein
VKDDEQWLQNLGYSAGEIEPNVRSRRPLGHPDDEALIGQAFSAHFEGKTPFYEIEHRIRHKSGSWRWILDRGKILDRDSSGQPLRVVGIHVDITEHRLAEDRFLQLANEQRAVLNTISMGICYIKNLRAQWINPALANMFGYEISDVQGQDTSIYYSNEEDYRRIEVEGAEQLAKGLVYSTEALMKRKDGSLLWCSIAGQAINARNREEGSIWVLHDITERRRTEQALRESEEKFRLIAETIDEIFWIFDIDKGCMTYASPGYKRVWGYSPEYFSEQGKSLEDAIHPDDREQVFAALGQMKDGKLIDYEHRIICPDESIRYIWNRAYPIHDEGGRLKQYVGVAQDVTAWKKAEEALRESKEYLNQIINCIGDPLFVKDDQHKFVLMNDAMCEISRIQREDLLGETAFGYLPKDIVAKLLEKEDEVLNSGRECVMEETIPDTQGNTITVMSKKTRFVDKAGNKQIIGLLHDITEYKQLQAQFLQAQKMEAIGVLAGGVAHDFNNLLNIINGYTELMLTDISQEHPLRADLQLVMDAGQRAASLTTQLLAFSRKQIVQLEILNLNHALESMNSMLRRLIGEDIELTFIGQPELGLINADPGQIHQIVMNLVVNSRDAMPQGGKLTIETANIDLDEQYVRGHLAGAAGPYVMLAVSDNGMGMDSETQSHVFEPFFTTKSKGKGTGLGLSTVYGIIKQSHGFIWVYSEPGKGTAFKIYFPRAEYQGPEIRAERKSAHRLQGRESVLVVEDEESVRTLACRILQEQGYAILEASSGNEALAIAQNHAGEIHLVLTDVVMPGIGGGELVSRITAARPGIKALFVSGYTDNAIVNHGTLDPGIAFLQKPFTIGSLARKVREVLDS